MSTCNDGQRRVSQLMPTQAAELIGDFISPVAVALRNLLQIQPTRRTTNTLPIFEVRYPYAACVAGPRQETDKFSRIMAPCGSSSCAECKQLMQALPNHRPLILMLEGSCEEYMQYEQFNPSATRRAPVRFYSRGEIIGINRLLNQLYLPSKPIRPFFGHSARRLSSGSLSVYFSTSISNPRLVEHMVKKMSGQLLAPYLGEKFGDRLCKDLSDILDNDHSRFFQLMFNAAMKSGEAQPWQNRLLFIPVEPLAALLEKQRSNVESREFLLASLADQFSSSRNTRSAFLRQTAIFNRLSSKKMSPYEKNTVHHLVEILRGEFPGFIPHDPALGDDFGPYTGVYQFMKRLGVNDFLTGYPALLRPWHLEPSTSQAVYYSLERPTLLSPIGKGRSFVSVAKKVDEALMKVKDQMPDVLDRMDCDLFISTGKPRGPKMTKKHREQPEETFVFESRQKDLRIRGDFAAQLKHANTNSWTAAQPCFHGGKRGFMACFMRIRTIAKAKQEDLAEKNSQLPTT